MKLRWAVAQKDFTFRGRMFVAGEVFQERSDLVGVWIHQKKVKPTAAPPAPPAEPEPTPLTELAPVQGGEIPMLAWNPQDEVLPVLPPQDDDASQPEAVAVVDTPSEPEPAPARRVYTRRVKPVTDDE